MTFQGCFLPSFDSFGKAVSEKNIFLEINQSETRIACGGYRGPYKDASYQVSIHLAKWFQRRLFFRNQPIRNKNCLWWPCLLTDRK
jgi:hypothetical protein